MIKKILVVDDDESILDAITLVLEDKGYNIGVVFKGAEVYGKIALFKPHIILLDVLMSGKDGREICKNIKSDPKTSKIPVIMLSAHPSVKNSALKFGADDFLAKPFQVEDLVSIIKKHIK